MNYAEILFLAGYFSEGFDVPALVQEFNVSLADDIEVILVLGDDEVIEIQKLIEPAEHLFFAELSAIEEQHTGVEVIVAVDPKAFFDVFAVFLDLHHCLFVAGADVIIADIGKEKSGNISDDHGIAVDVDGFIELRKHFGDEKAVIGGFGIVIAYGQQLADGFKVFADVIEDNTDVIGLHTEDVFFFVG